MKYLDYPELETLSRALTFESAECKVFTRLETYSCKAVKRERQLFKSLESHYLHSSSLSPPDQIDESLASPFGRLDQPAARKTLFLLIATLNGAFPDHDFSSVDPADFRRELSSDSVLNSLGTTLLSLRSNSNAPRSFSSFPGSYEDERSRSSSSFERGRTPLHGGHQYNSHQSHGSVNHPQLAAVLDDIMCIPECEVYTFHPDADSDPHASAEPDEEGDELDDGRYADEESLSGDESGGGAQDDDQDTRMSTPRARGTFGEEDIEEEDAPMFDEDLLGFGFTPAQSRMSSTVTTPRTPSSVRKRAGDFFSIEKQADHSRAVHQRLHETGFKHSQMDASSSLPTQHPSMRKPFRPSSSDVHSSSVSSSDDILDEDIDDMQGLDGLLWATYAFFYNRKLKRILFVSVWSRRNTAPSQQYTLSPSFYSSAPRIAERNVPPISLDANVVSTPDKKEVVNTSATYTSPAKRAVARSTGEDSSRSRAEARSISGRKRTRDLSASPAPFSLSPFPHDSPHAQEKTTAGTRVRRSKLAHETSMQGVSPTRQSEQARNVVTPTSQSAPTRSNAFSRHVARPAAPAAPPVVAATPRQDSSSRPASLNQTRPAGLDSASRKHRKIGALSS